MANPLSRVFFISLAGFFTLQPNEAQAMSDVDDYEAKPVIDTGTLYG